VEQKRKEPKLQLLLCMIGAGMIHPAMVFAATMFAAVVGRCKWFSEISSPREVTAFISLDWNQILLQHSSTGM
jgi:N-acetylglutamate synthase/N-acetylornithine aminotransferase